MRDMFRGYYRPTDDELGGIWNAGDLILDTNALLNLFRYTKETREVFLGALTARQARLWLPHEAGVEFHRNRLRVVFEQDEPFDKLDGVVKSTREDVDKILSDYQNKEHPSLDERAISAAWSKAFKAMEKEMDSARKKHRDYGAVVEDIFENVAKLYDGKVGAPYSREKLAELHAEAEVRYAAKTPPGYKDAGKPVPDKYGDFIIWKQILDRGSAEKRPAIFVTDDSKEDWWGRDKGRTHGPRPELVEEYYQSSGCRIHFYTPKRFLEFANPSVSTKALDEVEQVSIERQSRRRRGLSSMDRQVLTNRLAERSRLERVLRQMRDELDASKAMAASCDELEARLAGINRLVEFAESGHLSDEVSVQGLVDERAEVLVELDFARTQAKRVKSQEERMNRLRSEIAEVSKDINRLRAHVLSVDERELDSRENGGIWRPMLHSEDSLEDREFPEDLL